MLAEVVTASGVFLNRKSCRTAVKQFAFITGTRFVSILALRGRWATNPPCGGFAKSKVPDMVITIVSWDTLFLLYVLCLVLYGGLNCQGIISHVPTPVGITDGNRINKDDCSSHGLPFDPVNTRVWLTQHNNDLNPLEKVDVRSLLHLLDVAGLDDLLVVEQNPPWLGNV